MSLEEFIKESVTGKRSARRRKYGPEFGATASEIMEWLRNLGVTEEVRWDGTVFLPEPDEIIMELGPCRIEPETHWVKLMNNVKGQSGLRIQQGILVRTKLKNGLFYLNQTARKEEIDFDTAIDLMEEMVLDPKRPVRLK